MQAFGRRAKLIIYKAKREQFFGTEGNGVEIEGLRITARLQRNSGKHPNTGEITVTNVDPDTRQFLTESPLFARLLAGYGTALRLIFAGDIRNVVPPIQTGPDWVTKLQVGDGSRAFAKAALYKSYKAGSSLATVVKDIAASMGLLVSPYISQELQQQFTSGYTLDRRASDELSTLLDEYNYEWSIQNGQLQITRLDKAVPGQAIVINTVIGSPELTAPHSAKKGFKAPVLKCKTVLNSDVVPGRLIAIDTEQFSGTFKVKSATDVLDTHGPDWTTEIQGKPFK